MLLTASAFPSNATPTLKLDRFIHLALNDWGYSQASAILVKKLSLLSLSRIPPTALSS